MNIRERIKEKLSVKKITQKDLAQAVGVSPQTICDYLAGRRSIPYATLEKIFDVLGL